MNPHTSSLWTANADPEAFPSLTEALEVDAVVVGGGITGLTSALLLAESGKRVVLLEARTLCSGVTGYTTAHATEAVDARYRKVQARFGKDAARLVAASSRAAIDHIAARTEALAIACDLKRVPGYLYTEHPAQRDELAEEHEAARAAGLRVELDVEIGLPFAVAGTLAFADQLRFHPRDYVLGLARAFRAAGGRIFEHTRVVEIDDGEPSVVMTEQGVRVRATDVVCATHVPLNKFSLHSKLTHHQSYVAAFKGVPLPDGLFWDTDDPYHYLRPATVGGESYLVVGGCDHKTGEEEHTEIAFERLLAYNRARFGTDRPDFHWSAQVIEPADGLPYIGRNPGSDHVYVATGFSGNGMTYGTVAALLVNDLVNGTANPWAELFHPRRIKLATLATVAETAKDASVHLIGDRLAGPEVERVDQIERDQGRTMKIAGHRLAVYRDLEGKLHAVSAVCTHMGCTVKFNDAERTWDCPCHGSRFGIDGSVMDGPAVTALAQSEIEDAPAPGVEAPRKAR